MLPNGEQTKSLIRWFLAYVSGAVTGWLTAKNLLTPDQLAQVGAFFSSETVVSLLTGLGAMAWGLFVHTQKSAITVVDNMEEVKKVDLKPTTEGVALAKAVDRPTVVVAKGV